MIPGLAPASPLPYVVAALLVVFDIAVRALRTTVLIPVSFWQATVTNTIGDLFAATTPARAGADPARFARFVERAGADPADVLAAMAAEAVVGGAVLSVAAVVVAVGALRGHAIGSANPSPRSIWWSVASMTVFVGMLWWLARRHWRDIRSRFVPTVRSAWNHFAALSPATVAAATWWTIVSFAARGAILPTLLLGSPLVTGSLLWSTAIGALYALLLSPTPAGAGVVELQFFAGLRHVLSVADLAALVLLWRAYTYAFAALLGAMLLVGEVVTDRARKRAARPA